MATQPSPLALDDIQNGAMHPRPSPYVAFYALPHERTSFGFKDGISHPSVEGIGIPGTNPREAPIKAGDFIPGYPNEMGQLPRVPQPDALGRNGTYLVFRKLHTRVAAFRQYGRARSTTQGRGRAARRQDGRPLA